MNAAQFRFYAELNDFLPYENRDKELTRYFIVSGSVKGFVESFGVPHTEVDLVLINGDPGALSLIRCVTGDRVSVLSRLRILWISRSVSSVRPTPLRTRSATDSFWTCTSDGWQPICGWRGSMRSMERDLRISELAGIVARRGDACCSLGIGIS